jgi:hypothetical protein
MRDLPVGLVMNLRVKSQLLEPFCDRLGVIPIVKSRHY